MGNVAGNVGGVVGNVAGNVVDVAGNVAGNVGQVGGNVVGAAGSGFVPVGEVNIEHASFAYISNQ